jgi:hypothetical protein
MLILVSPSNASGSGQSFEFPHRLSFILAYYLTVCRIGLTPLDFIAWPLSLPFEMTSGLVCQMPVFSSPSNVAGLSYDNPSQKRHQDDATITVMSLGALTGCWHPG